MKYELSLADDQLTGTELDALAAQLATDLDRQLGVRAVRKTTEAASSAPTKGDLFSIATIVISAIAGVGLEKLLGLLIGYLGRTKTLKIKVRHAETPSDPFVFEISSDDLNFLAKLDAFQIIQALLKSKPNSEAA